MWLSSNGLTLDAYIPVWPEDLKNVQFVWKKWPQHFLHPKRQNICIKAQFEHIKDLQKNLKP